MTVDDDMKEKNNVLKTFLCVVFYGSVWGVLEATLGTLLHLPFFDKFGVFAASTAIMLPIAYFLMANCYKASGSKYAVFLMGILAASIKLTAAFVIGFRPSVYNPAIYIVVESLAMGTALIIFNPKNVISLKTLGAIVLANTVYQFSYLMINWAMGGTNIFASQKAWEYVGQHYLFTLNCVAILYSFAFGSLLYAVIKLAEKYSWNFDKVKKVVYHPAFASGMAAVALVLTIVLA